MKYARSDVEYRLSDLLNLKSTISQFLFASVFRDRAYLLGGSIVCRNEKDDRLLAPYLEEAGSKEENVHE